MSKTIKSDDKEVLTIVKGYKQGVQRMQKRAETGTDKSEFKGKIKDEVARLHPKRLTLKVLKIIEETPTTKTFRLQGVDQILPPFQAGQYINLFTNVGGIETARPYAISSCPSHRHYYDLTVKIVDHGFVTGHLLSAEVIEGQEFSATSPMGSFYHNPLFHGKDLVFLAGGSGIAPARSMINFAMKQKQGIKYHLIYCNSYENDVIFANEMRSLANQYENFTLTEVISRPSEDYKNDPRAITGHVDKDLLRQLITDVHGKTFYVCGPTAFNEFCHNELSKMSVQNKYIRIECNGPPKSPSTLPLWPQGVQEKDEVTVTVSGRGKFVAKTGEPLLNSLERNGYSVENACRSGECSLCRVKVLKGHVFNSPDARLRKSDATFNWVHSCVAFPTTDIEILY